MSFQVYGQGVDLNPALLGCIMSGGACLSHTGIPIVDQIFGGGSVPHHDSESFCRAWINNWCDGPAGYRSAYHKCRDDKKQFWRSAQIKMKLWPSDDELKKKFPRAGYQELDDYYFNKVEEGFEFTDRRRNNNPPYFTCTARQKYIWLTNRCAHTGEYKAYISGRPGVKFPQFDADRWAKMGTPICGSYDD